MKKRYEQIPVRRLQVDPDMDTNRLYVQREEITAWTDKIAITWDAEMLLPAIVSKRPDGTLVTIDGQHSNEAAKRVEGPEFLRDVMVYEDLTPQQEAKLFLAANKHRKPVKPFDNFRVAMTAGDELATRVDREVRSLGNDLQVASSPSANRVGAVQALLAMARTEGMVRRVLTIVSKAWGRDASTWDNLILRAVAMVLEVDGNWDLADDARLVRVLRAGGAPAVWKQNSVRMTPSGGGSSSRSMPMVQQIVADYNVNLDRDKMLLVSKGRKTRGAMAMA